MSDARTDFFSSSGKAAPPVDLRQARTDFFSGKSSGRFGTGKSFDVADDGTLIPSDEADYSPSALQAIGESAANTGLDIAAGVNRGVTNLAGLPGDTAQNLIDLGGAGYSAVRSAITGEDPNTLYQTPDRANVPLTANWFAQKLDSTQMGPVTQMVDPEDSTHRVLYNIASNVPAAMTGGRGAAMPTMVGGTAGALAQAAGADPATQTAVSMLAGGLAAKYAPDESPMTPIKREPETPETAQEKLNRTTPSHGAAGASVDLQKLSPELRDAVEKAVNETGGAVNRDVLARQIQADSLPVKVNLSKGQALGDERLISLEMNARGTNEAFSRGFRAQNEALKENLRTMRDQVGPDVFSTNQVEHGDTLISRYQAIDDALKSDISAKYQALEQANGGQFPVDGGAFIKSADAALASKMKGRYLPAEVRGDIEQFRDNAGYMTFEQFENLRTNLASAARTAERQGNGNAAAAVNIVRRELESLPMTGEGAKLKPLADAARSAAKARFDALDSDPAYKAAVTDSVPPDRFVQKFVIGGTRDNVAKLSNAMQGDEAATQTIKVATLDHLRKAAGIDEGYNGNFTQAGYNKALAALEPKLGSLLDPQTAETARNLGDVARYTQFQPRGSFVNNSNTFVAAAADKAADALEGAINYKAGGIPVGSAIRKAINTRKLNKQAEETFAPGAGLTTLSDLSRQGKKP